MEEKESLFWKFQDNIQVKDPSRGVEWIEVDIEGNEIYREIIW